MTRDRWFRALRNLGYTRREIDDVLQSVTVTEYDEEEEYVRA